MSATITDADREAARTVLRDAFGWVEFGSLTAVHAVVSIAQVAAEARERELGACVEWVREVVGETGARGLLAARRAR